MAAAAQVSLRLFVMAAALALFGLTTPASELVADLERRGVSPRLAFAASATLGAVPALIEQARVVRDAQRARGLDIDGGVAARIWGVLPLAGPVVLGTLHGVEQRALALEARAFGRPGRREPLWAPPDTACSGSFAGRSRPTSSCWSSSWRPVLSQGCRDAGEARALRRLLPLSGRAPARARGCLARDRSRRDRRRHGPERGRQVDALPGRGGARARVGRRRADRRGHRRRVAARGTPRLGDREPGGDRVRGAGKPAVGRERHRPGGSGVRAGQPRPAGDREPGASRSVPSRASGSGSSLNAGRSDSPAGSSSSSRSPRCS